MCPQLGFFLCFSGFSSTDVIIVGDVAVLFVMRVRNRRCLLTVVQERKSESVISVTPTFTQSKTFIRATSSKCI